MIKSVRGFTLVELLVVISIIAILSVIGMVVFSGVQKNARDARRRGDIEAIAKALEIYHLTTGSYPVGGWLVSTSSAPWLTGLGSYMVQVPIDPINNGPIAWGGTDYSYGYLSSTMNGATAGNWYMLIAHLESPTSNDLKSRCTLPDGTCQGGYNLGCGAGRAYSPGITFYCNQQ